jgi:hypothetical protein
MGFANQTEVSEVARLRAKVDELNAGLAEAERRQTAEYAKFEFDSLRTELTGSANVLTAELVASQNLLRKYIDHVRQWYIDHVRQCEGVEFIDKVSEALFSNVKFTDEEKAILVRLADDIAKCHILL